MSIDLWHRATAAVRERYRASAPALYGAGLQTEEDEGFATVVVPAPRRESASPVAARVGHLSAAVSR